MKAVKIISLLMLTKRKTAMVLEISGFLKLSPGKWIPDPHLFRKLGNACTQIGEEINKEIEEMDYENEYETDNMLECQYEEKIKNMEKQIKEETKVEKEKPVKYIYQRGF